MTLKELELITKETEALIAILKNSKTILLIYQCLVDKLLDIAQHNIENCLIVAEKEMRKFMTDNES